MSDERALIAAILTHHDEDTPRLMYADYLDENGQPERAEFIRVQCELARIIAAGTADPKKGVNLATGRYKSPPDFERWQVLDRRERELFNYAWQNWLGACREIVPKGMRIPEYVEFRRGFIERVTCESADWIAHGDAITREHPIRRVKLTIWPAVESVTRGPLVVGYRLAGRTRVHVASPAITMLCAEWPDVSFEAPT